MLLLTPPVKKQDKIRLGKMWKVSEILNIEIKFLKGFLINSISSLDCSIDVCCVFMRVRVKLIIYQGGFCLIATEFNPPLILLLIMAWSHDMTFASSSSHSTRNKSFIINDTKYNLLS